MRQLIPDWFKFFCYKLNGRRPWSRGYSAFLERAIKEAVDNPDMIERFKTGENLPRGYGCRLDLRIIERPWVLSRIPMGEGILLDAGSAMNHAYAMESLPLRDKKIIVANLNAESESFLRKGVSYLFCDLRELPIADNYFDYITCISTLPMIGMDNRRYINDMKYQEKNVWDFEKAVREFRRALKTGGKVFISVNFGKYQNIGKMQQFDSQCVQRIITSFEPKEYDITYYRYRKEGWELSDEQACGDAEFFDATKTKYFNKGSTIGFDEDGATSSRAVACIEMTK